MVLLAAAAAGEKDALVDSDRAAAPKRNSLKNKPETMGTTGIHANKPSTPDLPDERNDV